MEQQTEPSETDNGQTDESSPDPGAATEESAAPTTDEPAEENEPYTFDGEILYADMPDAPTGSYIGSYGLPVATGETKIGLGAWDADLEQDSYLSAEALDSDNLTLAAPLLEDIDYAIVPILAQVEYPTDGSALDLVLPDGVTLLDYYGAPAEDAESLLHNEYCETSAAVLGVYVQADADFTAQLVYTAPDGSTQTKTLYVTIDREHTVASPFADAGIAAYDERPIPDVTSGKITKVAKVNGTWLIWFNGEPAYCYPRRNKRQNHQGRQSQWHLADLVQRRTRLLLHPRCQRSACGMPDIHLCEHFHGWCRPVHPRRPLRQPDSHLGRLEPAFFERCGRSARCFFR